MTLITMLGLEGAEGQPGREQTTLGSRMNRLTLTLTPIRNYKFIETLPISPPSFICFPLPQTKHSVYAIKRNNWAIMICVLLHATFYRGELDLGIIIIHNIRIMISIMI